MTAALENRGEYRIRALVTAKPLTISLPERAQAQTQAQEASKTLIPPGLRGANNVQQQQAPTQPQQAQDQQQQTPVQQQQSPIQQQYNKKAAQNQPYTPGFLLKNRRKSCMLTLVFYEKGGIRAWLF